MKVACFCGATYSADPPVGFCPNCDAPPAISATSPEQFADLMASYFEMKREVDELCERPPS